MENFGLIGKDEWNCKFYYVPNGITNSVQQGIEDIPIKYSLCCSFLQKLFKGLL